MLEFLGTEIISLVEKALVNSEPELETVVVNQLDKLATVIKTWVEGKTQPAVSE